MKMWTNRISQFNSVCTDILKMLLSSPKAADGPTFKVYETPRSTEQIQTAHHQECCLLPEHNAASSIQGLCKGEKIKTCTEVFQCMLQSES